jgi:ribosomal protein L37AE/L43A
MPVNIHGKEYFTVAERLEQAKDVIKRIETEVLFLEPQIMVKATVETEKGLFTGISAANPDKSIEAKTPVEVAETSAVGRALAFAGYAGTEIASADEMYKADFKSDDFDVEDNYYNKNKQCENCGAEMVKNPKTGKWFCSEKCWLKAK